jgi:hypothetical protein
MFENLRQDLKAHGGDWGAQGFWVLVVYRFGRWRYGVRPSLLRKVFSLIYRVLFKFIQMVTGIELPCEVQIGRNFVIDHFGGIIISGYAISFSRNFRSPARSLGSVSTMRRRSSLPSAAEASFGPATRLLLYHLNSITFLEFISAITGID